MPIEVVEGWTGPIDVQLQADGIPPNLTGATVDLILKGKDDNAVTTSGNVTIIDAGAAKVRYLPDAADLVAAKSPYRARYKVTDGIGKIVFFPSDRPDAWKVWPQ